MLLTSLIVSAALANDPRAELLDVYKDRSLAADHLFLLDTGGTPQADLDALRGALGALVRTLPEGDAIEVLSFSDAIVELLPRTAVTADEREALALRLESAPLSPGGPSDLGLALATAIERLRAPDGPAIEFLVMASDLCHQPAPESPYAFAGGSGCGMIRGARDLESGLTALSVDHVILPVSLHMGKVERDGQSTFFRIAGEGRTLAARTDEPLAWVKTYEDNLPWRKLEAQVKREIAAYDLSAEVTAVGEQQVTLTLRSGLDRISVDLDSLRFSKPGLEPESSKVELKPDATVVLNIVPPEAPFSPIPGSRTIFFDGTLTATATLEPRSALSRLGVRPGLGQVRVPLQVTWVQPIGPPPWALALGLAAVAGGALAWRRRKTSG